MNTVSKIRPDADAQVDPLAKLREPFPAHQISKLPKPTKQQTEDVRADFKKGVRCKVCGSWHHPDVVHLDYVGHAALTDRLLDTDPHWSWEPVAFRDGLPAFDATGGLWIRLTVCGVTRLGYGHAAAKPNQDAGSREKEVIGDALRNAGMRFGAALDLWHKGDLHADDSDAQTTAAPKDEPRTASAKTTFATAANTPLETFVAAMKMNKTLEAVDAWAEREASAIVEKLSKKDQEAIQAAYEDWRNEVSARDDAPAGADAISPDEIPY